VAGGGCRSLISYQEAASSTSLFSGFRA
jgi:hypothetical protein